MVLKLHNNLTKKLEEFKPIRNDWVGLYTCGPTVYNYPHIGNYRAYIFADILKRVLIFNDYTVKHIMNLTDIDDKTIRDSQKEGKTLKEFTEFYSEKFYEGRDMLNIIPPVEYTKATDYIKEMLEMIEKLIEKGFAYSTNDGSVYFKISKDTDYGKLSHLKIEELAENASGRIKNDEYDKDNIQDFALWKSWDNSDGDVFWNPEDILGHTTVLTKGRPGWHIECSAMSVALLGEHFDIHTGGMDNMFPHHENEIAQSESATGVDFVNYWLHNGWLLVDGKKMAKSAGNFYILQNIIEKNISPLALRYLYLLTHYRTPLNFTWDSLKAAETALKNLQKFYAINSSADIPNNIPSNVYIDNFKNALNDDLNTPKALGVVWEMVKDSSLLESEKIKCLDLFDTVLGLDLKSLIVKLPQSILSLLQDRDNARLEKNWQKSDELRNTLESLDLDVFDTPTGTKVIKKI